MTPLLQQNGVVPRPQWLAQVDGLQPATRAHDAGSCPHFVSSTIGVVEGVVGSVFSEGRARVVVVRVVRRRRRRSGDCGVFILMRGFEGAWRWSW